MSCPTCNGTGYDPHNGGHIFNNQEEMDATHEHQCVHCPVPCPDCGGSGDNPMSDGRKDAKDIQIHAIPWEALQELGRVYHFGATSRGYGDYNFRGGYDWTLTFDALMRHAWAFWNREENDPESGFNHMAHAAWHALTLCFFALTERGNDDRPN